MAYRLAVFFMLSLCALATGNPVCPVSTQILPCTCQAMAFGINIVCSNFNSGKELRQRFQALSEYEVANLLLHGLNLTDDTPVDLFKGMKVKSLQMEKSFIKFAGPAFDGLEDTLKSLSMVSFTGQFELAKLPKLEKFEFTKNTMVNVSNKWLQKCIPNVQSLNLDNNRIHNIEEGTFSHLNELSEILLSDNRIGRVHRNLFPYPTEKLKKIDLSYNELSDLPKDIFIQMPKLEKVILSGNNLVSIPKDTWHAIWSQVNAVLLFENSIVCDKKIEWLKEMETPDLLLEGTCASPVNVKGKPLKDFSKVEK